MADLGIPEGSERSMAKRILVVDDEPDILELTRMSLARDGYEVETAATGDEAMACLRRGRPDLVVLDLMLPDRPGTESAARSGRPPSSRTSRSSC